MGRSSLVRSTSGFKHRCATSIVLSVVTSLAVYENVSSDEKLERTLSIVQADRLASALGTSLAECSLRWSGRRMPSTTGDAHERCWGEVEAAQTPRCGAARKLTSKTALVARRLLILSTARGTVASALFVLSIKAAAGLLSQGARCQRLRVEVASKYHHDRRVGSHTRGSGKRTKRA